MVLELDKNIVANSVYLLPCNRAFHHQKTLYGQFPDFVQELRVCGSLGYSLLFFLCTLSVAFVCGSISWAVPKEIAAIWKLLLSFDHQ